ncbi:MAG: hypothetical protein GF320_12035, partial [Armatimonadia bacterium]|nr:hypothetical protein [Armatimonadia bacterium]
MPRPLPALILALLLTATGSIAQGLVISTGPDASDLERLAAAEVQRYLYLRTGEMVSIDDAEGGTGPRIALGIDRGLPEQGYRLHTSGPVGRRSLEIVGGSPVGVLYGAYAFAAELGVEFFLHGDVVPDDRTSLVLPTLDIESSPLFEHRGIQPFHDFPEG